MLIKGQNCNIGLKENGSFFINNKNYLTNNLELSQKLYHQIFLSSNITNNDEINFQDIPTVFAGKFYESLKDILQRVNIVEEHNKIKEEIDKFGLSKDNSEHIEKEMYSILYKMGFSDMHFNEKYAPFDYLSNYKKQDELIKKLIKQRLKEKYADNYKDVMTYIYENYNNNFYDRNNLIENIKNIGKQFKDKSIDGNKDIVSLMDINDIYSTQFRKNEENNYLFLDKFISNYKEKNYNDFSLFNETTQDLVGGTTRDVLELYNDKVDESFVLDSDEFKFVNQAKQSILELQDDCIRNAVELGVEIPKELPRFKSTSNKFKDVSLNPQKAKMLKDFDFALYDKLHKSKSKYITDDGFDNESKDKITELSKSGLFELNSGIDHSTLFLTSQIIKHGGFDYDEWKTWAINGENNGVKTISDAYQAINNGVLHCNKLVECGILKAEESGTYSFTSPLTRDILLENPRSDYVTLANLVIDKMDITLDTNHQLKILEKNKIDFEKNNFFEYLDAQFESYYKPQEKNINEFKKDILHVKNEGLNDEFNSEEFNYCKDTFPALFNSNNFDKIIDEYVLSKMYKFVREGNLDEKDLNKNDKLYSGLVKEFKDSKKRLDKDKELSLIDSSIVKYDGLNVKKLDTFGYFIRKNQNVDKKESDKYIKAAKNRAIELEKIDLLVKNGDNFSVKDEYSKMILAKNIGDDIKKLAKLNIGIKVKVDNKDDKFISNSQNNKQEDDVELRKNSLIKEFEELSDKIKSTESELEYYPNDRQLEEELSNLIDKSSDIKNQLNEINAKFISTQDKLDKNSDEVAKLIEKFQTFSNAPDYTYSKDTKYKITMKNFAMDLERGFISNLDDKRIIQLLDKFDEKKDNPRALNKFLKNVNIYRGEMSDEDVLNNFNELVKQTKIQNQEILK